MVRIIVIVAVLIMCISLQIASHGVNNLIMLAGDAHLVAADDGANNDYSDNGGAGFPLFQSAPMDNYGSDKVRDCFL